jgi:imidazole glycerol phosphate synthase glutamine amidotransferase subunit
MISVIDYGAGNLRSVENALNELHASFAITSKAADVERASAILLPGVGHFGQMMRSLQRLGILTPLRDAIHHGVPYLGICLGMHALFEGSDEAPALPGLGIFKGHIRRFPEGMKVPHMGWNALQVQAGAKMFEGVGSSPFVYFAHSYYLPLNEFQNGLGSSAVADYGAAIADYGLSFIAAVEHREIFGTQFHPEKSGELGVRMLGNFVRGR